MDIGTTVSHYKILERLGQGGMGAVFKAQDIKLGRFVAIKVLPPGVGSDEELRERFMQEARAASAIDHPNIGSVYEIDESPDGELFIAMAYYEGKDLKHAIRAGPLPLDECVKVGSQIARGMSEAHARGIIHRDIKPANVVITPQGLAKIIDFGLAKLTDGLQLTRTGTSLGTLAYMSPEQLRAEEIGPETDIWALGIILFEMLTGKHPFHGEFEAALMYSIANEPPLSLLTYLPGAPPALGSLVTGMLAKNRSERVSTMAEVADALDRLGLTGRIGPAESGGPPAGTAPASFGTAAPVEVPTGSGPGTARSTDRPSKRILPAFRKSAGKIAAASSVAVIAIALYLIFRPAPVVRTPEAPPSIVVVPFTVTGEEDLRYLGSGMASEIADVLSASTDLTVISRKSASAVSEKPTADSSVAHTLGVRYVLRGDIRVTVAQIFYTVSLYDHTNGEVVWSRGSTISRKDISAFPRAMTSEVARLIGVDLPEEAVRLPTASAAAYESYLHGSFYRALSTKEGITLSLAYFQESISADSMFLPGILSLANTLLEQYLQNYNPSDTILTRAEGLCRRALALDSLNDAAFGILGSILDLRGDREGGLRMLNRSLEINPDNPFTLTVLGQMYVMETNEPVRGIVLLKKLQQIDPLDWLTNVNLGVAYAQSKNYSEALVSFRRAAELNPKHAWPVYSMGYLFEILGKPDSAAISYRAAIALDPTNIQSYSSLAALYIAGRKFSAAESLVTDALRNNPGDLALTYLKGVSAQLGNRRGAAMEILGEGYQLVTARLRKEPESLEYTIYTGLFAARLGKTDEAVAAAEHAARLDSTHEETAMNIARIYAAAGIKREAIEWFSRARAMNPEYNEAYLASALDFERLRRDPDILLAARK